MFTVDCVNEFVNIAKLPFTVCVTRRFGYVFSCLIMNRQTETKKLLRNNTTLQVNNAKTGNLIQELIFTVW